MKFIYKSIAALILIAAFAACNKKQNLALQDGTFFGSGAGRNGTINVSVTIADGKITDAKILSESETPEIGRAAEESFIEQLLQYGSTNKIDVISGATLTYNALCDAFEDALNAARNIQPDEISYSDTDCDIVIIGAGGAGLTAATEAASKGANVIVLEKMGIVGGNTNFSTGGINASYTKEQARLGIADSPEVFFNDTMHGGRKMNDPDLVRTLVDNSADMVEWLQSDLIGADLSDVGIFGGATNKRIHRPQGGGAIGTHLVPLLYAAAKKHGADIRTKNKVTDILSDTDSSRATGVLVQYDGGEYTILARAIIIATGGFGANSELITHYNPALAGFATTNHNGATGDAIGWVRKFDAALTQMEQIQTHPTVMLHNGIMITEALRGNGAILINHAGTRFVNEMETRDIISAAVLAQPEKTAYLFFDQAVRNSLRAVEEYAEHNLLTMGHNLAEMAAKLSIPQAQLEQTLSSYNTFVAGKLDSEFGRNPASMEIALVTPPFYSIEIEPAVHHTMGGIKIDPKAQVLTNSGAPVAALFAAGEVTGGVHGANRLGGNAVADICVFGKIAADSALEYIATAN